MHTVHNVHRVHSLETLVGAWTRGLASSFSCSLVRETATTKTIRRGQGQPTEIHPGRQREISDRLQLKSNLGVGPARERA